MTVRSAPGLSGPASTAVARLPALTVLGGVGTVGGIAYPLVSTTPFLPKLHVGYAVVALSMTPIVLLAGWVFRPQVAERTTEDGFLDRDSPAPATADDD